MAEIRVKETGTIKLFESDNTSSVTIASPASLGADRTITLPDASVTLASGTMLATDGSGASLTALNASELGSGTVPTARLGSGTASSSTFLAGDQTYKAAGGGKLLQCQFAHFGDGNSYSNSSSLTYTASYITDAITPTLSTSKIMINVYCRFFMTGGAGTTGLDARYRLYQNIDSAGATQVYTMSSADTGWGFYDSVSADYNYTIPLAAQFMASPATTDPIVYTLYGAPATTGELQIGASNHMAAIYLWEIDFS